MFLTWVEFFPQVKEWFQNPTKIGEEIRLRVQLPNLKGVEITQKKHVFNSCILMVGNRSEDYVDILGSQFFELFPAVIQDPWKSWGLHLEAVSQKGPYTHHSWLMWQKVPLLRIILDISLDLKFTFGLNFRLSAILGVGWNPILFATWIEASKNSAVKGRPSKNCPDICATPKKHQGTPSNCMVERFFVWGCRKKCLQKKNASYLET